MFCPRDPVQTHLVLLSVQVLLVAMETLDIFDGLLKALGNPLMILNDSILLLFEDRDVAQESFDMDELDVCLIHWTLFNTSNYFIFRNKAQHLQRWKTY